MNRLLGHILSGVVKLYQISLGSIFGGRCRFHPTCSEYARQALVKDGAIKGLAKSIWRILRCNPWNPGGYDPA